MVWGKKNGQNKPEPEKTSELEPRREEMGEELAGLKVAVEAAERFLEHAKTVKAMVANGATEAQIKKAPDLRRLKRASLDLSSELVIMRKELP